MAASSYESDSSSPRRPAIRAWQQARKKTSSLVGSPVSCSMGSPVEQRQKEPIAQSFLLPTISSAPCASVAPTTRSRRKATTSRSREVKPRRGEGGGAKESVAEPDHTRTTREMHILMKKKTDPTSVGTSSIPQSFTSVSTCCDRAAQTDSDSEASEGFISKLRGLRAESSAQSAELLRLTELVKSLERKLIETRTEARDARKESDERWLRLWSVLEKGGGRTLEIDGGRSVARTLSHDEQKSGINIPQEKNVGDSDLRGSRASTGCSSLPSKTEPRKTPPTCESERSSSPALRKMTSEVSLVRQNTQEGKKNSKFECNADFCSSTDETTHAAEEWFLWSCKNTLGLETEGLLRQWVTNFVQEETGRTPTRPLNDDLNKVEEDVEGGQGILIATIILHR